MTRQGHATAISLIDRALEIDPTYAVVAALGAWVYTLRIPQGWFLDPEAETRRGIELGRIAIVHGQDDSDALGHGGYAIAFLGHELHEGLGAVERAMDINPNSSTAFGHAGWIRAYMGRMAESIHAFERAIRLSPRDPMLFRAQAGLAFSHLLQRQFEEAITWGWKAIEGNPNFTPTHRALAAALAHAGRIQEARHIIHRLVLLVPDLTVSRFAEQSLFKHSGRLDIVLSGLREAGLPE
ncbi:tetratricopeptide repeat protein [Ensifer sp. IC4062]|nr:tetratricopeptide repeat protein [Ensifer sp. IC4062]MCA1441813.1 tetratricopeptide repeat protein [Ensifer sp. IC4062]